MSAVKKTEIEGTLLAIRHHNPDSHFCSLDVMTGDEVVVRVCGVLPQPITGEHVCLTGEFSRHHGIAKVFSFKKFTVRPPQGVLALVDYLIRTTQMTEDLAESVARRFGEDCIGIIEAEPQRLTELSGITKKDANQYQANWLATKSADRLAPLLSELGLNENVLVSLRRRLGAHQNVNEEIRANPYLICLFADGVNFKQADNLSRRLGTQNKEGRLQAAILQNLRNNAAQGHTYLSIDQLPSQLVPLIEQTYTLESKELQEALRQLRDQECIIRENDQLFLFHHFTQETQIALCLQRILQKPRNFDTLINPRWFKKLFSVFEDKAELHLIEEALNSALHYKSVRYCVDTEENAQHLSLALARLFSGLRANTVICTLGEDDIPYSANYTDTEIVTPYELVKATGIAPPKYTHHYPLDMDVVIIHGADRFSNTEMALVMDALPATASIFFVGDESGLKPYGSGQPFIDIKDHPSIPTVIYSIQKDKISNTLDKLRYALRTNQPTNIPDTPSKKSAIWMIPAKEDELCATLTVLLRDVLPTFDMTSYIDVLPYMIGTQKMIRDLNEELQLQLNPYGEKIHSGNQDFYVNDPISLTRWDRYNSLCAGTRLVIDELVTGPKLIATTPSGKKVTLEKNVLHYIRASYVQAPYTHPGYLPDTVILIVPDSVKHFFQKHHYYHAARIAAKRLVLIGNVDDFLRTDYKEQEKRHTGLKLAFERNINTETEYFEDEHDNEKEYAT